VQLLPFHRAYCHSATMDNMPLALVEAMSCGRPILAAPVGGIPEIFTDGVEGRYWMLDNAAKAAEILIDMLENQARYLAMSRAAQERFATKFDAAIRGRHLLNFLYS